MEQLGGHSHFTVVTPTGVAARTTATITAAATTVTRIATATLSQWMIDKQKKNQQ